MRGATQAGRAVTLPGMRSRPGRSTAAVLVRGLQVKAGQGDGTDPAGDPMADAMAARDAPAELEDVETHEWAGDLYEDGDETVPEESFAAFEGQEGEEAWLDRADDTTLTGWVRDADGTVYRYVDAKAWAVDVDDAGMTRTAGAGAPGGPATAGGPAGAPGAAPDADPMTQPGPSPANPFLDDGDAGDDTDAGYEDAELNPDDPNEDQEDQDDEDDDEFGGKPFKTQTKTGFRLVATLRRPVR